VRVGPGTLVRATTADPRSLKLDVAGTAGTLLLGAGDGGGVDLVSPDEPGRARRLGLQEDLFDVALSPDGRRAASTGLREEVLCVWDVPRAMLVRRIPLEGGYLGATFGPDGRWLVTGVRSEFCFWEVGSWERKARLPRDPRSLFCSVAFARGGRLLALAEGRNRIGLYDAAALPPRPLATLEIPGPASLSGLSLSPDGTRLAASTDYSVVALWDLRRLRRELAALDLDWDMPPYPPPGPSTGPGGPLAVEVLSAPTGPR
jgi:WD40 repeat protein